MNPRYDAELDALAARFIAEHGVTRLPAGAADAVSVSRIRPRMRRGVEMPVSRGHGPSKRKIVFKPASTVVERIVQDEGEARRRQSRSVLLGTKKGRQRQG
jgi:hypothetical protein